MSGFFGCVSRNECVNEVFYGTDYHSHLGTKRAGMAFLNEGKFVRSIHSLEDGYFRNKFESELPRFGNSTMGIGVISDCESQPITITSHLGRYAVASVARIDNIEELTKELLEEKGNTIVSLSLPRGVLVVFVKRNGKYLVPNGTMELQEGDFLLTIASSEVKDEVMA